MTKPTLCLLSACLLSTFSVFAFDEDQPRERPPAGPRDGDRPPREGDRDLRSPPEGRRRGDGDRDHEGRPPMPHGPILSALDTNHNGRLESEEIDRAIVMLRRMDRNRDGQITHDEFARPQDGQRPPRDGDRPPRNGERPAHEGDRPSPEQMREHFRQADRNNDGSLSKAEAPDRLKASFDRVDRNGDGKIDNDEFEQVIRHAVDGPDDRPPREGRDQERREGGDRRRPEVE